MKPLLVKSPLRVHLVGIGGIGMSGLARLLMARGDVVSGSDASDNALLQGIRRLGGRVWVGHSAAHLDHPDLVVYSSSIAPQNPELLAARNRGVPVLHRGQMVAELLAGKKVLAVTGTHGKSTTAAMAAQLLIEARLDPTVLLGAEVKRVGGNARLGRGPYAVVEADESDGSLLWLAPTVALLTNVDEEHLDYFRNRGEIEEMFAAFAERVDPEGVLIGCADDPAVGALLRRVRRRQITYGFSEEAQLRAEGVHAFEGGSRYRCYKRGRLLGEIRLQVPGIHNVVNGLGVVALAEAVGIDFPVVRKALKRYAGAKRRFQIQGEAGGVLVVEDYAHHPAEIEATLRAARSWQGRRLRVVFQPHRYSRTHYLLPRFVASFALADELVVLPIYAASEDPLEGVSAEALAEAVRRCGKKKVSVRSAEETLMYLRETARPGDMVLFLGAGSIGGCARKCFSSLTAARAVRRKTSNERRAASNES